jgi:hypothetical protein
VPLALTVGNVANVGVARFAVADSSAQVLVVNPPGRRR